MRKIYFIAFVAFLSSCTLTKDFIAINSVEYPSQQKFDSMETTQAPSSITINKTIYSPDFIENFDGIASDKKQRVIENWEINEGLAVSSVRSGNFINYENEGIIEFETKPVKYADLSDDDKKIADSATKYLEDDYVLGCAQIVSKPYKYGYIEARIGIEKKTKGHWYYFYTIGSTSLPDGSGSYEYDVIEQTSITDSFQAVAHWTLTDPKYKTFPKNNFFLSSENIVDWHTYGILWTEDLVTYYLDGVPFFAFDISGKGTPFILYNPHGFKTICDVPMNIILGNTIANGGSVFELWIGSKVDVEKMLENGTDKMRVDYVARYKSDEMESMLTE